MFATAKSASRPKTASYDPKLIGALAAEFEALEPNPNYNFNRVAPPKDAWPLIVPKHGPPIGDLPQLIQNMIASTWKIAEPAEGATRGNISIGTGRFRPPAVKPTIGARGAVGSPSKPTIGMRGFGLPPKPTDEYHPQVRPTFEGIGTKFGNQDAIASDWKLFEQIKRTNAVTFRGDTRPPVTVLIKAGGFYPPNSRKDEYYLENAIFEAFADYVLRRWGRELEFEQYKRVVFGVAIRDWEQQLVVDYMMWRKICERESIHLGRMTDNECLKGYISTSPAIDTSIIFGTSYNRSPGWLYVTVVHGGFQVPWGKQNVWGTVEGEVAQWGPVPAERIVAFRQLKENSGPQGPLFFRRSFRNQEPMAFDYMYDVMSGMTGNVAKL